MKDHSAAKKSNFFTQEISDNTSDEHLHVLTDREIEEKKIPKGTLWFMLLKDEPIGPFHENNLFKFLEENPQFPRDTKISNFNHPMWLPIYRYSQFQRRRSDGPSGEEEENFWILENGLKKGPYTTRTVAENFKDHTYLPNQLISQDKGNTWQKISDHPLFQKIKKNFTQLKTPTLPSNNIFKMDKLDERNSMRLDKIAGQEGHILLALGLIDRHKNNKTLPYAEEVQSSNLEELRPILTSNNVNNPLLMVSQGPSLLKKIFTLIGVLGLFTLGIGIILWNFAQNKNSFFFNSPADDNNKITKDRQSKTLMNERTFTSHRPGSPFHQQQQPLQRAPNSFMQPQPNNFPRNPMVNEVDSHQQQDVPIEENFPSEQTRTAPPPIEDVEPIDMPMPDAEENRSNQPPQAAEQGNMEESNMQPAIFPPDNNNPANAAVPNPPPGGEVPIQPLEGSE